MAEINFRGLDEFMLDMQQIAEIPEEVQDEMLNAQADITVRAQQEQAEAMGVHAPGSGLTIRSIKKGRVKVKKGVRTIYVTPTGSRVRGGKRVRNAEIAFINEYGKKNQKARPFIKTANEKSAEASTQAAFEVYDRWLKSKDL